MKQLHLAENKVITGLNFWKPHRLIVVARLVVVLLLLLERGRNSLT